MTFQYRLLLAAILLEWHRAGGQLSTLRRLYFAVATPILKLEKIHEPFNGPPRFHPMLLSFDRVSAATLNRVTITNPLSLPFRN